MQPEAVLVAAARTPIGRAGKGSLAGMRADDLGAIAVRETLARVPQIAATEIDDVIVGCGQPAGLQGHNIARVIAILAGLEQVPATTVHRYCASSLQAIRMATHAIRAGEGDCFVAAGVESASGFALGNADSVPDTKNPRFDAARARTAERAEGGAAPWTPATGLPDVYAAMGQTAENVAELHDVSRAEMDAFAARSQQRAVASQEAGLFAREIVAVETGDGTVVAADDGPRAGTTAEVLGGLRPVFRPDGRVTAGNACPLNDGAAAVVVTSAEFARRHGIEPLARVVATGVSALDPEIMGLGPVAACQQALARAGMTIADVDRVEMNEAFAAQVIPAARELGIAGDRLNVRGGAIALGHPFGMTGARIATTLLSILEDDDLSIGLETMCTAGGQGMALILERLS
jgi:acetyl-CoA C-acetyltransferase